MEHLLEMLMSNNQPSNHLLRPVFDVYEEALFWARVEDCYLEAPRVQDSILTSLHYIYFFSNLSSFVIPKIEEIEDMFEVIFDDAEDGRTESISFTE